MRFTVLWSVEIGLRKCTSVEATAPRGSSKGFQLFDSESSTALREIAHRTDWWVSADMQVAVRHQITFDYGVDQRTRVR
ncbi:hypothetical protein R6Q59_009844 [Mikania micrantha]